MIGIEGRLQVRNYENGSPALSSEALSHPQLVGNGKLNTRPTPMIQIIAGTPQMKLLTALLIASIVDNIRFFFLPT